MTKTFDGGMEDISRVPKLQRLPSERRIAGEVSILFDSFPTRGGL
jgi:hypothetical protein